MRPFRSVWNPLHDWNRCKSEVPSEEEDARAFHRELPGYRPTPLVDLPGLARQLGVGRILLKDESKRFGLDAFKCLGASYAMFRYVSGKWQERFGEPLSPGAFFQADVAGKLGPVTFTSATDGNHGRAVAWTARQLGQQAVIYIPEGSSRARIEALGREGAEVVVFPGNYDRTVEACRLDAEREGRQVISDTAWEGYTEIPTWITAGYRTLFEEIGEQLDAAPQVVFLQAGVGGLASAGVWHFTRSPAPPPHFACVEPLAADCLTESAAHGDGQRHTAAGKQDSIMAGLNCGVPSMVAWPILCAGVEYFLALDDDYARQAMRLLARPQGDDPAVIAGESGAAGLAGLLALVGEPDLAESRARLGLDAASTVLLVNTEGDTDPVHYQEVLAAA